MKKLIILSFVFLTTVSQAVDFANEKGRDYGGANKISGIVVGSSNKRGFRVEAVASTSGSSFGNFGVNLGLPLLSSTKYTIVLTGGISSDPFILDSTRYKVGVELEYKVDATKSFILQLTNKYDPFTQTFRSRPTITTGARFYF